MQVYRTTDGIKVKGTTARDVVKALRAGSRDREPSLEKFMRALATRAFRQTGCRVPTHSQTRFVAALERAGLLIKDTTQ